MKMRHNAAVIREGEGEVEGIRKCLLDPRKVQYIMSSYNCSPPFTSTYSPSPSSPSSTTSAAASFAASSHHIQLILLGCTVLWNHQFKVTL